MKKILFFVFALICSTSFAVSDDVSLIKRQNEIEKNQKKKNENALMVGVSIPMSYYDIKKFWELYVGSARSFKYAVKCNKGSASLAVMTPIVGLICLHQAYLADQKVYRLQSDMWKEVEERLKAAERK